MYVSGCIRYTCVTLFSSSRRICQLFVCYVMGISKSYLCKFNKKEYWFVRFIRFHGNYNSVYGGQSGDAFLALTGGCSEYIDFDDALEADACGSSMEKARAVHTRLKNACRQGDCMLTTEVPVSFP